jgi:hypothetical protein
VLELLENPLFLELLRRPENQRRLLKLLRPRRKKSPSTNLVPLKPTSPPSLYKIATD